MLEQEDWLDSWSRSISCRRRSASVVQGDSPSFVPLGSKGAARVGWGMDLEMSSPSGFLRDTEDLGVSSMVVGLVEVDEVRDGMALDVTPGRGTDRGDSSIAARSVTSFSQVPSFDQGERMGYQENGLSRRSTQRWRSMR